MYCVKYKEFDWRNMNYGVERRKAFIDHILIMGRLLVNRKYVPQIYQDPDLKYLMKKGKLKQVRYGQGSRKIWKIAGSNQTYLVLV